MKTTKQEQIIIKSEEPSVDNKLELLKYTAQVQSRIKNDITSDFILAKLNDKDKEAITELTNNAYYVQKIINTTKEKSTRWIWNNEKQEWTEQQLTKQEKEIIKTIAEITFDAYMIRIYMCVLLNRNVPSNHILGYLSESAKAQEEEIEIQEQKGIMDKIKGLIKPAKKENNE